MRIFALLSWYDERPDHLRRCVRSLEGFADVLVAVDGAYATFPGIGCESPSVQHWALSDAARTARLGQYLVTTEVRWPGEVEKRAALFHYGRTVGATPDDWFLIIDADMALAEFTPDARDRLAATDRDVAEVRWQDIQIDGVAYTTRRERFMYRALPGLTVERAHFLYTTPTYDPCECGGLCVDSRRFLWRSPDGHLSPELSLDLFGHVTLHHFNSQRDPERKRRALDYYKDRDARGLEAVGRDWTGRGELA